MSNPINELEFQKGNEAIENKDYPAAIIHFTNYLKTENSSSAFQNRAFAYMNLNKQELAKPDLESVIEITIGYLNKADKNDEKYIDLCMRDIILAKATLAQIETNKNNFQVVEDLNTELISLYLSMFDNTILREDFHISRFYSNRGHAKFLMNKIDDSTLDMAAAIVESNSVKFKNEVLNFAQITGTLNRVKDCIVAYSILKNSNTMK